MEIPHTHQDLLCCICLEFLDSPKVLACSHIFCENCLTSSSTDNPRVIACPRCQARIPLPAGGVASLHTDDAFVKAVNAARTSTSPTCSKHPENTVTYWCNDCQDFLCEECGIKIHNDHTVNVLADSASWSTVELVKTLPRVSLCEQNIRTALNKVLQREEFIREKQAGVEGVIRQRQKTLLQWVLDATVKSLTMLESSSQKVSASLHVDKIVLTEKLTALNEVKENMASRSEVRSDQKGHLIKKNAMITKLGSKEHLQEVNSDLPFHGEYPVLRFNDSFDCDALLNFIGHVSASPPIPLIPEVTTTPTFRCGTDPATEIHAICPTSDRKVWVAYHDPGEGEVVSLCNGRGRVEKMQPMKSRVCISRIKEDWVIVEGEGNNKALFMTPRKRMVWVYTGPEKQYRLYSKRDARFYLCVHKHGACDLRSVLIKDGDNGVPATSGTKICKIALSKSPLAVDVSKNGETVAVLETGNNKVLLFKTSNNKTETYMGDVTDCKPYTTYPPTDTPFQPVDLCFCLFRGQECLVVADWLNDELIVLHVTAESCDLIGHVGGGCAEFSRPTAVTGDDAGKLWVGCQGGHVLVIERKEESGKFGKSLTC